MNSEISRMPVWDFSFGGEPDTAFRALPSTVENKTNLSSKCNQIMINSILTAQYLDTVLVL